MTEDPHGRLGRRLRRILIMLPYAIQHPGIGVDELARKFAVDKRELIDDLNLVFMCGLPGYGPGDLIDVTVDDDRVWVRMADYFAAPLRMTPAEALALYAGAQAIAGLPGMEEAESLRRAVSKLGRALGAEQGLGEAAGIEVQSETSPTQHLEVIRASLEAGRRIRMEYLSASSGKLSERIVDPWGLVSALGRWYLIAFDHSTSEERMFRTDRIKTVEMLEESSEVPADFEPDRYAGAFVERGDEAVISFEISPDVKKWFGDYYPLRSQDELRDGWTKVELVSGGERWAATLLLRLGDGARNPRPDSVVEEAVGLAGSVAARYAEGPDPEVR